MRVRAAVWPTTVVVGWAGAVWAISAQISDENTKQMVAIAVAVTVLAGALLGTWWAVVVPCAVILGELVVTTVLDPHCHDCGDESRFGDYILSLVYVGVPGSVVMAVGVCARKLVRWRRSP